MKMRFPMIAHNWEMQELAATRLKRERANVAVEFISQDRSEEQT